jgi:hypothetical protein
MLQARWRDRLRFGLCQPAESVWWSWALHHQRTHPPYRCSLLQVGCEAGCEPYRLQGNSAPAYMEPSAPKLSRPAMCFTQPEAQDMDCVGVNPHARRLCACTAL